MASFTDRIPTFNPYVQQQPVQDMVKVGMMKQQQYDSNVQKIKQSMSNIAGLNVSRDVDKEYLQQKMNETSQKMRLFAAGDFSRSNLTSSVNNMVNSIAQDSVVQNSVRSTMAAQSARALQAKYNSEGKGSPSNDYALAKQMESWYNDPNPGASFNGQYIPYTDYKADSMEIIKNLAKDYTENEVAFDFDDKGNIVGVRDAISNTVIEGITPQKIQTALQAGLTPAAWNQISMDGIYQYSGVSDGDFIRSTRERYTSIIESNNKKIDDLKAVSNNAADAATKQELNSRIQALEAYNKSIGREFSSITGQIESGNIDGAKAKLFTTDWMNNMANSFSSTSIKRTYKDSPFMDVQLRKAKMRQDANIAFAKMEQDERHFEANWLLDKERNDLKRIELGLDDSGGAGGSGGSWGNMELPKPTDEMDNDEYIKIKKSEVKTEEEALNAYKNLVLNKFGITEDQLTDLRVIGKENKNALKLDMRNAIDKLESLQAAYDEKSKALIRIEDNAEKLYPTQTKKLITTEQDQVFTADLGDGLMAEFSTSEAIDAFALFNDKYSSIDFNPLSKTSSPKQVIDDNLATKDFKILPSDSEEVKQEKMKKSVLYSIWRTQQSDGGGITNNFNLYDRNGDLQDEDGITDYVFDVAKELGPVAKNRKKDKNKFIATELKQTNLDFGPRAYGIKLPKEAHEKAFKSEILAPLAAMAGEGGIPGSDVSEEKLTSYINYFDSAFVSTDGQGNNILYIYGTHKDDMLRIPMDEKTYRVFKDKYEPSPAMKLYYEKYVPKMLSNVEPVEPIINPQTGNPEIDEYGNVRYYKPSKSFWTTSTDGSFSTNIDNAALTQEEGYFSRVKYYTVSGNISSDSSPESEDYVYLKMNITDPINGKLIEDITFPGMVPVDKVDEIINGFTDEAIWQMLNPTQKSMPKEVEEALEKASKKIKK